VSSVTDAEEADTTNSASRLLDFHIISKLLAVDTEVDPPPTESPNPYRIAGSTRSLQYLLLALGRDDLRVVRCQHHYVFYLQANHASQAIILAIFHEQMDCLTRLRNRLE
jgi:hypothetical protein